MTLDHATQSYVDECARLGTPRLHEMSPGDARAFEASFRDRAGAGPHMHREFDVSVEVADARIPMRCLVPTAEPDGVVVYFHGGG